jgi:hypothetical protein
VVLPFLFLLFVRLPIFIRKHTAKKLKRPAVRVIKANKKTGFNLRPGIRRHNTAKQSSQPPDYRTYSAEVTGFSPQSPASSPSARRILANGQTTPIQAL